MARKRLRSKLICLSIPPLGCPDNGPGIDAGAFSLGGLNHRFAGFLAAPDAVRQVWFACGQAGSAPCVDREQSEAGHGDRRVAGGHRRPFGGRGPRRIGGRAARPIGPASTAVAPGPLRPAWPSARLRVMVARPPEGGAHQLTCWPGERGILTRMTGCRVAATDKADSIIAAFGSHFLIKKYLLLLINQTLSLNTSLFTANSLSTHMILCGRWKIPAPRRFSILFASIWRLWSAAIFWWKTPLSG